MYSNRGIYRAMATLGIGVAIALLGAAPAHADETVQIVLDPADTAIEYGQFWNLSASMTVPNATTTGVFFDLGDATAQVHVSGQDDPYVSVPIVAGGPDTGYNSATSYVYTSGAVPPLDAGDYDVTMSIDIPRYDQRAVGTSAPAHLSISPAAVATDVRAVPDPSNADNIVVTATLGGDFVTRLDAGDGSVSMATLPAGTWHVTMTTADGTVALDESIDQAAGIEPSTTLYWTEADPGVEYTADATFTPVAASAGNFAIAPATAFPFIAGDPQRPVPTSTAAAPPVSPESEDGPVLPLWSVIGAGLIAFGLLVVAIILAVRLRAQRTPSTITQKETSDVA